MALELGLPCGGWCPRDRRAEDGRIDDRYPLEETPKIDYAQRTEWNVRDSDATLILTVGEPTGGTKLTADLAAEYGRPLLIVDLAEEPPASTIVEWIASHTMPVLNIAGPRESTSPGVYEQAMGLLRDVLKFARTP